MRVSVCFWLGLGLVSTSATAEVPGVSAEAARHVDAGDIVDDRVLKDGVVRSMHAGRVQAPARWVSDETWHLCGHAKPDQLIEIRFYDAETLAKAARPPSQLDEDAVRALDKQPCAEVVKAKRFFSFAVFAAPALMPDMWSLIENVRTDLPDGGADIRAEQVAGSMGSIITTTHIRPAGDGRADWVSINSLSIGMPMPDALLNLVVPKADKPPRKLLLQSLRTRAKTRPPAANVGVDPPAVDAEAAPKDAP
jgi:hypothetical protein